MFQPNSILERPTILVDPFLREPLSFSKTMEEDKERQQITSLRLAAQIEQQELEETAQAFAAWKNVQEKFMKQLIEENKRLEEQIIAIQKVQKAAEEEHNLAMQTLQQSSLELEVQKENLQQEVSQLEIYPEIRTTTQIVLAKGEFGATTEFPNHLIHVLDQESMDTILPPNCSADYIRTIDSLRPGLRGDVSTQERKIAKVRHFRTMSYAPIKYCTIS